jgi:(E)-4-hydroxy-3-methylbut-2-enyl-diphosphate synthase
VIKTVETLEKRLEHIKTPMSLSIIGCVVNGPGEALMTDVGFTGGGAGSGMVYLAGKQSHKMNNEQMVDHIVEQVEARATQNNKRPRDCVAFCCFEWRARLVGAHVGHDLLHPV